jgi:EAL domain-containing protein (putative c-di-GMP-specific phosphodiesterase class I)
MQGVETSGKSARTVVKTIIALGRELGMRITVEGVESAEQAAFLDSVNADQVQGYFFGRPVSAAEVSVEILKSFRRPLPARHLTTVAKRGVMKLIA